MSRWIDCSKCKGVGVFVEGPRRRYCPECMGSGRVLAGDAPRNQAERAQERDGARADPDREPNPESLGFVSIMAWLTEGEPSREKLAAVLLSAASKIDLLETAIAAGFDAWLFTPRGESGRQDHPGRKWAAEVLSALAISREAGGRDQDHGRTRYPGLDQSTAETPRADPAGPRPGEADDSPAPGMGDRTGPGDS